MEKRIRPLERGLCHPLSRSNQAWCDDPYLCWRGDSDSSRSVSWWIGCSIEWIPFDPFQMYWPPQTYWLWWSEESWRAHQGRKEWDSNESCWRDYSLYISTREFDYTQVHHESLLDCKEWDSSTEANSLVWWTIWALLCLDGLWNGRPNSPRCCYCPNPNQHRDHRPKAQHFVWSLCRAFGRRLRGPSKDGKPPNWRWTWRETSRKRLRRTGNAWWPPSCTRGKPYEEEHWRTDSSRTSTMNRVVIHWCLRFSFHYWPRCRLYR